MTVGIHILQLITYLAPSLLSLNITSSRRPSQTISSLCLLDYFLMFFSFTALDTVCHMAV